MKKASKTERLPIPGEKIEKSILLVRRQKVMLDRDLAALYGVTTGNLNKAVDRNLDRFPDDFMFRLSIEETRNLIFQFGISRWGGTRKAPRAFTEQGVAMLSGVLRSKRAAKVNVEIMRAFVRLRRLLATHAELAAKLDALEKKCDAQFKVVFDAIRQLMAPPDSPKRKIGFRDRSRCKCGLQTRTAEHRCPAVLFCGGGGEILPGRFELRRYLGENLIAPIHFLPVDIFQKRIDILRARRPLIVVIGVLVYVDRQ